MLLFIAGLLVQDPHDLDDDDEEDDEGKEGDEGGLSPRARRDTELSVARSLVLRV